VASVAAAEESGAKAAINGRNILLLSFVTWLWLLCYAEAVTKRRRLYLLYGVAK